MAEKGNPEAQYNVGWNYFHGEGVPQDNKEALKWYRLAAEQGHAKAQFNLGGRYSFLSLQPVATEGKNTVFQIS